MVRIAIACAVLGVVELLIASTAGSVGQSLIGGAVMSFTASGAALLFDRWRNGGGGGGGELRPIPIPVRTERDRGGLR